MGIVTAVPLDLTGTICRCRTSLHYILFGLSTDKQTTPDVMAFVRESYDALEALHTLDVDVAELTNLMASLVRADVELLNNHDEYRTAAIKRIGDILILIRRII